MDYPPVLECVLSAGWRLSWSHFTEVPSFSRLFVSCTITLTPSSVTTLIHICNCARSSSRLVGLFVIGEVYTEPYLSFSNRKRLTRSARDDWYVHTFTRLNHYTIHYLEASIGPVQNVFLEALILLSFVLSFLPGVQAGDCFNDGCAATILCPSALFAHCLSLVMKARQHYM